MTKQEALDLGVLAMELLPRTTAGQAKQFTESIMDLPPDLAESALREHARTNEADPNRLCLPGFRSALDDVKRNRWVQSPGKKREIAKSEFEAVAESRHGERVKAEADVAKAREFCESHPDQLDFWRSEIVGANPSLEKMTRNRATLDSTVLVCAIYAKYGSIPVECWR